MKRLFIDHLLDCVRLAVTVDGKLTETYFNPIGGQSLVGRVYVGRVRNLLPGDFAFVDIGTGKNLFINLPRFHGLKKNDTITVQAHKDAYGTKGPYGGMQLRLKGGHVIVIDSPRGEVGVSHKITDARERERLRALVHGALEKGFGAIVRTHAEGCADETLTEETRSLIALRREITARAQYAKPPALLHPREADDPAAAFDLPRSDFDEVWEGSGLFEAHNILPQIERALQKTVPLRSGGHLTIEQTEACVVIDVNTGAFSGSRDYRAAVLQTNLEAAEVIAAQLLLRNLSGIIIIDFIDMYERGDKDALIEALRREIKKDRIKTEFCGMTELGLVQLTRRRTRPSLSQVLTAECPACKGSGRRGARE